MGLGGNIALFGRRAQQQHETRTAPVILEEAIRDDPSEFRRLLDTGLILRGTPPCVIVVRADRCSVQSRGSMRSVRILHSATAG